MKLALLVIACSSWPGLHRQVPFLWPVTWLFVTTWVGYFIVGGVLAALAVREVRELRKPIICSHDIEQRYCHWCRNINKREKIR